MKAWFTCQFHPKKIMDVIQNSQMFSCSVRLLTDFDGWFHNQTPPSRNLSPKRWPRWRPSLLPGLLADDLAQGDRGGPDADDAMGRASRGASGGREWRWGWEKWKAGRPGNIVTGVFFFFCVNPASLKREVSKNVLANRDLLYLRISHSATFSELWTEVDAAVTCVVIFGSARSEEGKWQGNYEQDKLALKQKMQRHPGKHFSNMRRPTFLGLKMWGQLLILFTQNIYYRHYHYN